MLQQLEALFTPLLPRHWLSPEEDGVCSRQRDWSLRRTCWTFLAQVLSPGSACPATPPVLIARPACGCRWSAFTN